MPNGVEDDRPQGEHLQRLKLTGFCLNRDSTAARPVSWKRCQSGVRRKGNKKGHSG